MNHLKLILCFLVFSFATHAQTTKVQGTVISADDREPLIGVNITVKGTSQGVVTDIDGQYSIDVSPNAILVFSYVGFNPTEQPVNGRTVIDVTMDVQSNLMDEVIVMGYSSTKKAELSSSIVTLSSDELLDVTSSDIGNMLQGKVSGVVVTNSTGQPGSGATIQIRGTGSITAAPDPLFVVDGIPGGAFNPNDVETITVLKDAGATALYGSAAAGGVIVVTTKQAGRNQPTRINFKATYGFKDALQGNFKMMNSQQIYDAHKQMFSENLFPTQRPEELRDRNFDWLDAAFRTGQIQNYHASAAGSSDRMNYYASMDWYQEDGTLRNTDFTRFNSRLNLNTRLSNTVDMSIRLNYTEGKNREATSYINLEGAYGSMPWDNPYDAEGNLIKIEGDKRPDDGSAWYTQDKRNFLYNEQYNYARNKSQELVADFQLNWNILDWLSFTTSNRYSTSNYKYRRYIDPRTVDPEYANGYVINNIGMYGGFGTTNLLKANHEFGEHTINGLLGWEAGRSTQDYTSAAGTGMPNGMDGLNASSPYAVGGYRYKGASWSAFAQAQYSYRNRYFLTGSIRADANSVFGKNNRVGYFPSVAGSWLISNEEFMQSIEPISFLKLRASYGVTGNSNIPMFRSMAVYGLNSTYQDQVGAYADRLANPDLSWETAHMSGIGLDISFLNRLHLNLDIYNIDNKDLLLNVPKPTSTGFYERLENAGSVRNRGIEVQISSDNIVTKDFYWNTTFNIGLNRNKVMSLPDGETLLLKYGSTAVAQQVKNGQDIFSWYMPKWLGVDYENGDPVWEKLIYDDAGNVIGSEGTNDYAQADLQVVGRATPNFSGGFTNTLKYKGFGLLITANFVQGNKVYNYTREKYDSDGAYLGYNMMQLKSGWNRWEEPGDLATHPKLVMNGNKNSNKTSSRYLEDGGFFRIRNITFSYDLPRNVLDKAKLQNCKFFVSGDNLFTFTKFSGTDPEVGMRTGDWSMAGLYSESYPVSRQFLFGVEIGF